MLTNEHSTFLGQQIGNYEVKELLIERTTSNLYLAQEVDAGRPVFLEILHPFINHSSNLADQFRQRMESVAQLEHPGIAAVHEVGVSPANVIYAAIEFVPGVPLAQKVAAAEAFTTVEALRFVKHIAGALAAADSAGIIHHDLRPESIIVSDGDRPVLIDLGVPIVANVSGPPTLDAAINMFVHSQVPVVANVSDPPTSTDQPDTLDYTPPERLRGEKLTIQSSIYSLGVILYQLLTGHRPRLTTSPWDIFENTARTREVTLEEAREGLRPETYQLARDSLRRQEWARYESMEQMSAAIDTAIAAEQGGVPDQAAAASRSSRRVWGAAAGGVVLLALLLLLWFGSRSGAPGGTGQARAGAAGQNNPVLAGAQAEATATATATLSPTPVTTPTSVLEVPIQVLAPADSSEFSSSDNITFGWTYVTPLATGQQFVISLLSGGSEAARLGPVTEPVIDTHYRLVVEDDDLEVPAGVYEWQIVLEDSASGARLAASSTRAVTFLVPTPTSSPSPTATATLPPTPSATPTPTPTPCIVSPWPTWVRYTIQFGDALSPLAVERGTLVEEIKRVNCLKDNDLSVGQVLWLPPLPATDTPTPTNTPLPSPTPGEGTPAQLPPPPPPPAATQPPAPTGEPPTAEPPTLTPPP